MKIEQPRSVSKFLNGAFQFDAETLRRLRELIIHIAGGEVSFRYELELKSGTTYKTDEIADLDNFPFHQRNQLNKFSIRLDSKAISIWPSINFDRFGGPVVHVYVSGTHAAEVCKALCDFMNGARATYSWMYRIPMWVILMILPLVALGLSTIHLAYFGISLYFMALLFLAIRTFLFPKRVLLFGAERSYQENLRTTRKWIVGTAPFALAVALFGAWARGLFHSG